MKRFSKFATILMVLMLGLAFVSCSNGSSSDSDDTSSEGSSNSSSSGSYTTVAGGTYKYSGTSASTTYILTFNDDENHTVTGSAGSLSLDGYIWDEDGTTINVSIANLNSVAYTFTANSSFTKLTYNPTGYGAIVLERQ